MKCQGLTTYEKKNVLGAGKRSPERRAHHLKRGHRTSTPGRRSRKDGSMSLISRGLLAAAASLSPRAAQAHVMFASPAPLRCTSRFGSRAGLASMASAHVPTILFVECGFGCDQHGQTATKAAVRACRNVRATCFRSEPANGNGRAPRLCSLTLSTSAGD